MNMISTNTITATLEKNVSKVNMAPRLDPTAKMKKDFEENILDKYALLPYDPSPRGVLNMKSDLIDFLEKYNITPDKIEVHVFRNSSKKFILTSSNKETQKILDMLNV